MSDRPDRVIRRAPVLWRSTIGAVLVRVPGGTEVTQIGGTGVALWEALEEPRTFAELSAVLATQHGVDAATVAEDLGPVVDDLIERGAILGE